jgi:maltose 6'-phosphate phosphatase
MIIITRKFFIFFAALLLIVPRISLAWYQQARCPDVSERGYLSVLTLNLLYSEFADRESRFDIIADFVAQKTAQAEPIDIILLQEVVGGLAMAGTKNSSHDLKKKLAERDLIYNLRYCPVNDRLGLGFLTEGIAILSRCKVLFTLASTFTTVWETPNQDTKVPLKRKGMMSRIKIPGAGNINVFNTHLCAFCDSEDRSNQNMELLKFISDVDAIIWWTEDPFILGGDFNLDLETPGGPEIYNEIIDSGFIDTYSAANGCQSCCSTQEGYEGCTYAVSGNPYANNSTKRIDYIFARDLEVINSTTVFKSDPFWVSDHSGVLSKLAIH